MKHFILIFFLSFFCAGMLCAQSQANADSVAYQLQRKKINTMLESRRQRFGQYGKSLNEHTGIFGLQTKSDIRRSADILMDIVKTDDQIYKELKILFDYRDFQQRQIQNHSREAETTNIGFMNTINKLRHQNALLKTANDKAKKEQQSSQRTYLVLIVLMFASILYLFIKKNKAKA